MRREKEKRFEENKVALVAKFFCGHAYSTDLMRNSSVARKAGGAIALFSLACRPKYRMRKTLRF